MNILVASMSGTCDMDAAQEPSGNPLQDGFIHEGCASDRVGDNLWYDSSEGTGYGNGSRYACEETPFMTRVKSKHR